jgi:hypothetical protein
MTLNPFQNEKEHDWLCREYEKISAGQTGILTDDEKKYLAKEMLRCQCYKTFYGRKLRIFFVSWSICPWQAFPASSMFVGKERSLT